MVDSSGVGWLPIQLVHPFGSPVFTPLPRPPKATRRADRSSPTRATSYRSGAGFALDVATAPCNLATRSN